jgi:hypothetical protein
MIINPPERMHKVLFAANLFAPRNSERLQRYTRGSTAVRLVKVLDAVWRRAPLELAP